MLCTLHLQSVNCFHEDDTLRQLIQGMEREAGNSTFESAVSWNSQLNGGAVSTKLIYFGN